MMIYIDADGAPWRDLVIEQAIKHGIRVVVIADYSHDIPSAEGVERVVVDGGVDATDFAIVNRVQAGDLVITQDVGLASLVLPKGVVAISPRGFEFTEASMGRRLARRWLNGRIRKAGGRIKGPPRFSQDDRERFLALLEQKIIRA
ncbi:MAG: YaiI/YqxD family protein [Deltaproteobacteria bacterium]|nr:YaiI/YqxD family protein [Deltaproteobacteria bacterium]